MELTAEIINGFATSLLHKNYDNPVDSPECHYEWWELCTSKAPKVAIAAPRKHAKSTAITLAYVLASVLFRDKSYCLIVSDTITQAIQFLQEVKKELSDNDNLRSLFQIDEFLKESEDDIIVQMKDRHQFRITAKGSEQKLRGLKWNNKRPDLIVGDDMENDELVMNKDRREKFKRWFYGALIPCLSSKGVIRLVGTVLHEDSLLNNLMPAPWDRNTVFEPLKISSKNKRSSWISVKYRAHTEDFRHILWPENYTQDWFLRQRQDFIDRGISDVYSQEYLNEPIDPTLAYFKKNDFLEMKEEDYDKQMNFYIAADLAISKEDQADYSVFVIAGVDENKTLYIRNIIRERLDGREIVDMLLQLQRLYEPELFGIEEMQVSKSIGPFLREEMVRTNTFLNLRQLKTMGKDKTARAKSIQGRLRAHAVKFDKSGDWYSSFEDEMCKFPRGRHDDQVDAIAYIGLMLDSLIEAPTQKELDEEEYNDELRSSGYAESGRSAYTGY